MNTPIYYVNINLLGLFTPTTSHQERGEKCTMGLTALLTMLVMLLILSETLPKSADEFPRLGKHFVIYVCCYFAGQFVIIEMVLIIVATGVAIIIMYVHSCSAFGADVPRFLLALTFQCNEMQRVHYEKNVSY